MRTMWRRIRAGWNRNDTVLMVSNHAALALLIGNCWWKSVVVCCLATSTPIIIQIFRASRVGGTLRDALLFGGMIAIAWPFGEGLFTMALGWWGEYLAPGPVIWKTPLYCVLVGWVSSTHLYYVGCRFMEFGYGRAAAAALVAVSAFGMGLLGENLFVWSGMWRYEASGHDWWDIPAFLPVAYGLGYGVVPYFAGRPVLRSAVACGLALTVFCASLGVLSGFFPR